MYAQAITGSQREDYKGKTVLILGLWYSLMSLVQILCESDDLYAQAITGSREKTWKTVLPGTH